MSEIKKIFSQGIWKDNPVFRQILGICSALAVTNLLTNSFVMGIGLCFVTGFSCLTVSLLRHHTPKHIRMMVQTLIISAYVIMLDIFLKAYFPSMSKALGPYVGLIITNCIIMGRAEAFYIQNNAYQSILDAISNGIAYSYTLIVIAVVREALGFGTLLGIQVMPDSFEKWVVMTMAPGAFFLLGIAIWISKTISEPKDED